MKSNQFSIKARIKSFTHAGNGIASFLKSEHNAWIHLAATIIVVIAGLFFRLSSIEWIAITIVIGLVWIAEMLNTAIEKAMDRLSPDIHPAIKLVKDIAAGAVLIASIVALITGLLIFLPYFTKQ